MRFLRGVGTQGAQFFLDVRENLPTDVAPEVQLAYELRALRYFEEFRENIVRWWVRVPVALIAGQLSAVQIGPTLNVPADQGQQVPRDSLLLVDEIENRSGQIVNVNVAPGALVGAVFVSPRAADDRWGQGALNQVQLASGQAAGATNVETVDFPASNVFLSRKRIEWVSQYPAGGTLEVAGSVVATAINIILRGRLVLAR